MRRRGTGISAEQAGRRWALDTATPVHQRVVLSPYFVVGGPDYRAMAHTGCPGGAGCAYRETLVHQSAGPPAAWPHCRGALNLLNPKP